jgi:pimeloyl-ACP methyl ester carboxylesterase
MPRVDLSLVFASLWFGATALAAPEPELTVHRLGELSFRACALSTRGAASAIDAFCGQVEVPLDHANPSGPKLMLAVAWLKPLAKAGAAPDPAVFLAGGPGQSSREQAASQGRVLRDLRRHHHLLFIDQRGSGESSPLQCPGAEAASAAAEPDEHAKQLQTCRAGFTVDQRFFTTRDAVEDLEFVRQKLGAVRYNLIGVSYGTRLAQEYARLHPDGVRTMVLDGVVPSTLVLGKGFGRSLDVALEKAVGRCEGGDAGCTPPLTVLDEALAQLRTPRPVTYEDPFTGEPRTTHFGARELMSLIHLEAYHPLLIATFAQTFRDAHQGNLARLAAQQRIFERSAGIALGLHFAIACAEDAPRLQDVDGEAEAHTRLGRMTFDAYRAVCRDWPHREAPPARLEPLKSEAPTLLLSGEWDPVTPPDGAEAVAGALTQAKHVVLRGQGHHVLGVGCVPAVVARFVESGRLTGLDTSCAERVRPLRSFTSRTGWSP